MNHFKIQKTELLFVLICLFISVCCIHAVAYRGREHAKGMVCAANLHLNGQSVLGYADDHDGNVIINNYGNWAQDFSYSATDDLIYYGSNRQAFYCPSKKYCNAFDPRFWQYTQQPSWNGTWQDLVEPTTLSARRSSFRIISYLFLLDTPQGRNPFMGLPQRDWIVDIDDITNPSEYEMITDVTMSTNPSGPFYNIMAGGLWAFYGIAEQTNHLAKNGKPLGCNTTYVDGHVAWKSFEQMQLRLQMGIYFWW